MIEENQLLVIDELVGIEKQPIEVGDFKKNYPSF